MNETPSSADGRQDPLRRYIPLLLWLATVCTLLYVSLRIIALGHVPPDDALRHVGKALSGKDWSEILVLRPGITLDHNAGWHAVLRLVHRLTGWDSDGLLTFSVVSLAVSFLVLPLVRARRPEAWLAALLTVVIASPLFALRPMIGRPLVLVMGVTVLVLWGWARHDRVGWREMTITTGLLGLSAWVHGGWYLYGVLAVGFFLARQWRRAWQMTGCWLAGSLLGAVLTGRPFEFLVQQLEIPFRSFGSHSLQGMLVLEFQPSDGLYGLVMAAAAVALLRSSRGRRLSDLLDDPIFLMAVCCWALGLAVQRVALDWGVPALLVWLALEFERLIERLPCCDPRRLVAGLLLCASLAWAMVSDRGGRWTVGLNKQYPREGWPEYAEWLPEPGGIVYSDQMTVFYDLFFRNPRAPWRYVLGFEPTFMTEDNLAVYRQIQLNQRAAQSFEPWVRAMRPEDRMILQGGPSWKPDIRGLEWGYPVKGYWMGRLPRATPAAASDPEAPGLPD